MARNVGNLDGSSEGIGGTDSVRIEAGTGNFVNTSKPTGTSPANGRARPGIIEEGLQGPPGPMGPAGPMGPPGPAGNGGGSLDVVGITFDFQGMGLTETFENVNQITFDSGLAVTDDNDGNGELGAPKQITVRSTPISAEYFVTHQFRKRDVDFFEIKPGDPQNIYSHVFHEPVEFPPLEFTATMSIIQPGLTSDMLPNETTIFVLKMVDMTDLENPDNILLGSFTTDGWSASVDFNPEAPLTPTVFDRGDVMMLAASNYGVASNDETMPEFAINIMGYRCPPPFQEIG